MSDRVIERFEARTPDGWMLAMRRTTSTTVEGLTATRFNTFHLLYADHEAAFVTWSDGARISHAQLSPGLHVVTERSLGGDDHGRTQLIEAAWPRLPREGGVPTAQGLEVLLGTRGAEDPTAGVCVDVPEINYGTRSSLVLFVAPGLRSSRWYWADGRPDTTPFVEHPWLIEELSR